MKFKSKYIYLSGIVILFVLRAILNAYVPLMDKTEARYAEIARIMQETGNWNTPQIDYGVPFWAKPPLSTWLSALSMKVFGVNEFAVRLPYLLAGFLLIIIITRFVKNKNAIYFSGFVLMTIPEFLLHTGVVSTDTILSFSVALIFLSFWKAINRDRLSYWGYLIFTFIGIGLLSKGPLVLVLTVPPIFIWVIYFKEYKRFFKQIPLISGSLLTLTIAVPWYYLAEMNTNGFLEYFIVGEHFKRFFDSSWDGDKYGFAKSQPLGIIWLFLFAFAFPWIQVLAVKLWKRKNSLIKDRWAFFLLLWLLWTPFFFTFSKSLIHTYILPSIVPIALLIDYYWAEIKMKKTIISLSLIFPVLVVVTTILSLVNNNLEFYSKTDKYLLQNIGDFHGNIYYLGSKSYSSQFYSKGEIQNISIENLKSKTAENETFKVIIKNKDYDKIEESVTKNLKLLDFNSKNKIYANK